MISLRFSSLIETAITKMLIENEAKVDFSYKALLLPRTLLFSDESIRSN